MKLNSKIRNLLTVVVPVVAVMFVAGNAYAAEISSPSQTKVIQAAGGTHVRQHRLTGTATTISATSWDVGGQTFSITATTIIAAGIKTGDTVKVVYYVSGTEQIATKIALVSAAQTLVSYSGTIQPMLNQGCSCHVLGTQSPRLDNYANVYAARTILPGMGSSYLTAAQEQTLATWISQGAPNN